MQVPERNLSQKKLKTWEIMQMVSSNRNSGIESIFVGGEIDNVEKDDRDHDNTSDSIHARPVHAINVIFKNLLYTDVVEKRNEAENEVTMTF